MHSVAATINWEKMRFISWGVINRPYQSIILMSLSDLLLSLTLRSCKSENIPHKEWFEAVPDYLPHMPAILYHNNMKM